jgi:hypothetical protein
MTHTSRLQVNGYEPYKYLWSKRLGIGEKANRRVTRITTTFDALKEK